MKSLLFGTFALIKKHYILSIVIFVIMILLGNNFFGSSSNNEETITLSPTEFIRTVAVAGKVKPADDVDLGFESTGRIVAVYKKEGDHANAGETLAVISSGEASSNVMKAQADLDAEIAKLNELKGENVDDNSISTTRNTMFSAITNAYFVADDSVYNKINSFYNDETLRSNIVGSYDDIDFYDDYKKFHSRTEYILKNWKKSLSLVTSLNYTQSDIEVAETNLTEIKKFVELTARVVNEYNSEDSSVYTRTEADALRAQINLARENINSAINKINDAKESTRDTKSEIPYQEARVKSAEATLNSYRSELSKRSIVAPFNGVITKQDAKVGEIVSANTVVMRLISDAKFTIETYVPEINISEVKIGNTAKVTLDAYGDEQIFEAKIVSIDPGETIRDGVSTYKVLFEFVSEDDRLKSGMTANVIITTETKTGALLVPQESIIKRNGFSYVNVQVGKEKVEKQITTGSVASNGFIEIIAGLQEGEVIIKNVK